MGTTLVLIEKENALVKRENEWTLIKRAKERTLLRRDKETGRGVCEMEFLRLCLASRIENNENSRSYIPTPLLDSRRPSAYTKHTMYFPIR